jgi:hypothetical protein
MTSPCVMAAMMRSVPWQDGFDHTTQEQTLEAVNARRC